jgi:hypothetical protein
VPADWEAGVLGVLGLQPVAEEHADARNIAAPRRDNRWRR